MREILRGYGTSGLTAYYSLVGDMPVKNWGGVASTDFPIEKAAKISDDSVLQHQKRRYACQSCPLGCGGIIDIQKGRYKGIQGHKPEYEGKEAKNLHLFTAGLFFVQLLNGCGMCIFGALTSILPVIEYLNAATGWDLSADDYLIIGERIFNLRKAFNFACIPT